MCGTLMKRNVANRERVGGHSSEFQYGDIGLFRTCDLSPVGIISSRCIDGRLISRILVVILVYEG